MAGFEVVSTEPLTLDRGNRLADMYVLSPFVWRDGDGFQILLRAVPRRDDEPRLKMAEIWRGSSNDGLHFVMDQAPLIFPGPALVDLDGCEDPTVLVGEHEVRVWYTGFNQQQATGRLLLARGPELSLVAKAGVALESQPPFANPKEASVVQRADGGWTMFFEYAHSGASLIGRAAADGPDGPWRALVQSPLHPRKGAWDSWHLSPGPILDPAGERPIMFYNGADQSADWRIGWAAFDQAFKRVVGRSEAPLIKPDDQTGSATDIAFAASAVEEEGEVWLYFSQSDQDLRRARLRRV